MSHDYANKYANYGLRRTRSSKLVETSRMLVETYNSEFAAIAEYKNQYPAAEVQTSELEESQKYFKKVAKSKTYQDLCKKEDASRYGRLDPQLELAHFRGRTLVSDWYGTMRLQETNCPYTIIHEFAHLCGNMHHDIGFRRDVIKLSSRFFGVEFAKMLKGQFKKNKLKVTVSQHIMTPEKWIESVCVWRKYEKEIYDENILRYGWCVADFFTGFANHT